jgi:hypothetical protein
MVAIRPCRPRSKGRVAIGRMDRRVGGDRGPPVGGGRGVPFAVEGTDRGLSRDRDRTVQPWSCGRPRSAGGPRPDDPNLPSGRGRAAGSGHHAWALGGRYSTSSQHQASVVAPPRGRSVGHEVLTRPTTACPRASRRRWTVDVFHPRRGGDRADVAGPARVRKVRGPRGCEGTIPGGRGLPRVLVRVTSPTDRSAVREVQGRNPAGPGSEPVERRTGTRRSFGIAEANPGDYHVLSDPCVGRC